MTLRRVPSRWFVLPLLAMLIVPQGSSRSRTRPPRRNSRGEAERRDAALDTLTGHRAVSRCAGRADPGGLEGRWRRAEVRRLAEDEQRPQGHRTPDAAQKAGFAAPISRWRRSPRSFR